MKNLLTIMLCCSSMALAQQTDPVVMTINGQPITRSEFEYSYNKNNAEGVIDKKTVDEYVDLFINYKLKVIAAQAAKMDTARSFKTEFATYRDQQIRPAMITDADVEQRAREIYRETQQRVDGAGGLVKAAHILFGIRQTDGEDKKNQAKLRADSAYNALLKGADFATLAKRLSDDKGSAEQGGELPWIEKGQTLKEFEDMAFSLRKGELSKPFLSPAGYHIVLLKDKGNFFPYDSLRTSILRFIEQRGIREQIISQKIETLAKAAGSNVTAEEVLAKKRAEMVAKDPNLKYLIQEYHDGLLLFEISSKEVWAKAQSDERGQADYFKKNKKKYKWEQPRFKGIAYYTKDKKDVKAVRKAVKHLSFDQWTEKLRSTFNNDSILRIKVEKGIFKAGDNSLVDRNVFGKKVPLKLEKDYPYAGTYGKKLKAPKDYRDVKAQVVADYQDELEKQWVERLRKQYAVTVNRGVLATVNKH